MSNKIKLAIIGLILSANEARAASPGASLGGAPGINLTLAGVINIFRGLACWIVNIALILIVVAVVFYGIKFLISQGDPGKVGEARKGLGWGIVGILIILGTYTIIASVANSIGATPPNLALGC